MKTILLLLMAAFTAGAASIPGGRDAWLKLLAMPAMNVEFVAGLTTADGLVLSNDQPDPGVEIPRLRAQLKDTPADATLFWQMSRIYSLADDYKNRSNTLARAVVLYRQQTETQPENVEALTGFGLALSAHGQMEEAEAVLRRAAGIDPKDWRVWAALAQWHDRKMWRALGAMASTNHQNFLGYLLDKAMKRELPAGVLEAAGKSAQEAAQSADRAIELAPKEPRAYENRAQIRSTGNVVAFLRSVALGLEQDAQRLPLSMFGPNVLADLWRVAQLSPDDPRPQCLAVMGQITVAALTPGKTNPDEQLLKLLPDAERRLCMSALDRLQEISQTRPPADAAFALETTAILKMVFLHELPGGEADARRAIGLSPAREIAWDIVIIHCVKTGRPEEARSLAEKRLKVKDTARNRVIAAKVCDKLGRLADAQTHVDAALKLEPDGYPSNLAAYVIALKRSTDQDSAQLAFPFLEKLQEKIPPDTLTNEQRIEISLAVGIGAVLADEPADAREFFEDVLKGDKDNKTARQALAMLAGK